MDGESTTAQGNKGGTESKTAEERIAWTEKDVKYIIRLKEASKAEIKRIRNRIEKSYEWLCLACCRGIKDKPGVKYHVSSQLHKLAIQDCELNEKLSKLTRPSQYHISCLSEFVVHTYQNVSAAANNQISVRQEIAKELEVLIQKLCPDVGVGLHGSSVSEFALVTSDVNLNVVIPGCDVQKELPARVMRTLVSLLTKETTIYRKVKADFFSFNKIPRVLFEHKKSKLRCEVRINVGAPKSLSLLLCCYQRLDQRVLQLGVVFRYWAKVCQVDCQVDGHYPGHLFFIMAIHFLQQRRPPVIPVLHEMFPSLLKHEESSDDDFVGFVTEDLVHEVLDKLKAWQCPNSEPVGLLWHDLLKYYVVDFKLETFAVSILQHELIDRKKTQWGTYRLAVEDPTIRRSNVARAGSSDKVFEYLWSCLKKTVVYFNSTSSLTAKLSEGVPPCESSGSIGLEDECIVYATKKSVPSSSTQTSFPAVTELTDNPQFTPPAHLPGSNSCSADTQTISDVEKVLQDLVIEDLDQLKDKGSSVSLPTKVSPLEVVESKGSQYELLQKNLTYHSYPVTCLSCKKLKHNILNCPVDDLPQWQLSDVVFPPQDVLRTLKDAFRKYRKQVSPNTKDMELRREICDIITTILKCIIPEAELELFGSSANGFGTYYSDLDICLKLPYAQLEQMSKTDKNELIERVAKEIARYKEFHKVCSITTARVPIVKFYFPKYQQECDVSLCNYLALRNTKMILAYATLDDRAKLLGYAVKHFAKVCDMGDASTGSLSSYAYILMVIHYLQRTDPPVLPCLQKIFPPQYKEVIIHNWNCYYFEDLQALHQYWPLNRPISTASVGQLWLGFLEYFLRFDWAKEVVTIRQLEPLYKFDKWWMGKHMCIEDPFDLDHNLASSIGSRMRAYILERFHAALKFHCNLVYWKDIDHLMERRAIVGDDRAPKFFMCRSCGRRGHKAEFCPDKMKKSGKGPSQHRTPAVQVPTAGPHQAADPHILSQIPPFQALVQSPGTSPLITTPLPPGISPLAIPPVPPVTSPLATPPLPPRTSPLATPLLPHETSPLATPHLSPGTSPLATPPLALGTFPVTAIPLLPIDNSPPPGSSPLLPMAHFPVLLRQGSHPHVPVQVISSTQRPISQSSRVTSMQQKQLYASSNISEHRYVQQGLPSQAPSSPKDQRPLMPTPQNLWHAQDVAQVSRHYHDGHAVQMSPTKNIPVVSMNYSQSPLLPGFPGGAIPLSRPSPVVPAYYGSNIRQPVRRPLIQHVPAHVPSRPVSAVPILQYGGVPQYYTAHGLHPQQLDYPAHGPHPQQLDYPAHGPHPQQLDYRAHGPHPQQLDYRAHRPHPQQLDYPSSSAPPLLQAPLLQAPPMQTPQLPAEPPSEALKHPRFMPYSNQMRADHLNQYKN